MSVMLTLRPIRRHSTSHLASIFRIRVFHDNDGNDNGDGDQDYPAQNGKCNPSDTLSLLLRIIQPCAKVNTGLAANSPLFPRDLI